MPERPIMDDGTPFDPSSLSHVAERLSVRTAEAERLRSERDEARSRVVDAALLLGEVLVDEPRPPSFLQQAESLAQHNATSAMAQSRLAQAQLAVGDRAAAGASARSALAQHDDPIDSSARTSAALTLMACGEIAEAEHVLSDMALDGPLLVLYATAAARRQDYPAALDRLDRDDSAAGWNLRAWCYLHQRSYGKAVHAYRETLRRTAPTPEVLTNLGLAHALLGQTERAIAVTRQAMALKPSRRVRVGLNLSGYYLVRGHIDESVAVLRDLQRTQPHDIEPLLVGRWFGPTRRRTDERERGRGHFQDGNNR